MKENNRLGVIPESRFEDMAVKPNPKLCEDIDLREGLRLMRAFLQIENPTVRESIVEFVEKLQKRS
jgi:hypothetical protein